jgi:hypothetical protein
MNADCPAPLLCAATRTCQTSDLDAVPASIIWKGITSTVIPAVANGTSITIGSPTNASGDVLIAVLAIGHTGESMAPTFTPPTGWTVVRQTDEANDSALVVYWHVATVAEPATYTFAFNEAMEGVGWVSDYANVSTTAPIDAEDGLLDSTSGVDYTAPRITTTVASTMLMAVFASHDSSGTATTWSTPAGTDRRIDINDGTTRSAIGVDEPIAVAGATPALATVASTAQEYALIEVLALRPGS